MTPTITSSNNPKIKQLMSLDKVRERRRQNLFTIEGVKELSLAKASDYQIETIYYSEAILEASALLKLGYSETQLQPVGQNVFDKIAYRETTGGVIATARPHPNTLGNLKLKANACLLILESVEKPGNLGAILRTADAAGVDAVICCDPQTDFYNPNVVRSSVGCIFTNQLATATSEEAIGWLREKKIKIFCTYLAGSVPYTKVTFNQPCAIVMGSEATGLTDVWVKNSDANIIIPMKGKIDSMNVSVAAAVVVFEAMRQRETGL